MAVEANLPRRAVRCEVVKTDASKRLVFGFAIICKRSGVEFTDLQTQLIPEDVMFDASLGFAKNSRVAKDMHSGEPVGSYPFIFPLTTEIAAALEIKTEKTGLLVAGQFNEEVFAKFESGELTSFSIAGNGLVVEEEFD